MKNGRKTHWNVSWKKDAKMPEKSANKYIKDKYLSLLNKNISKKFVQTILLSVAENFMDGSS